MRLRWFTAPVGNFRFVEKLYPTATWVGVSCGSWFFGVLKGHRASERPAPGAALPR